MKKSKREDHKMAIHNDQPKQAHPGKMISSHDHAMHKGPHHDKYIASECQVSSENMRGEHEIGDKSHISSVMGKPHGADVTGHQGKMSWKGSKG